MSKVIPGDDLHACQPWLVPDMGKGKARHGGPLTAGQMEALQEQARGEGFQRGLEEEGPPAPDRCRRGSDNSKP